MITLAQRQCDALRDALRYDPQRKYPPALGRYWDAKFVADAAFRAYLNAEGAEMAEAWRVWQFRQREVNYAWSNAVREYEQTHNLERQTQQ